MLNCGRHTSYRTQFFYALLKKFHTNVCLKHLYSISKNKQKLPNFNSQICESIVRNLSQTFATGIDHDNGFTTSFIIDVADSGKAPM